jgi:hypothetical protein
MDPTEITQKVKSRFDHSLARQMVKEKYQAKMVFAHAGGMWRAGPELTAMIFTCGKIGEAVLLDLYETPVKINTTELMALSQQRWQEQMNAWLVEYEQLNKNR